MVHGDVPFQQLVMDHIEPVIERVDQLALWVALSVLWVSAVVNTLRSVHGMLIVIGHDIFPPHFTLVFGTIKDVISGVPGALLFYCYLRFLPRFFLWLPTRPICMLIVTVLVGIVVFQDISVWQNIGIALYWSFGSAGIMDIARRYGYNEGVKRSLPFVTLMLIALNSIVFAIGDHRFDFINGGPLVALERANARGEAMTMLVSIAEANISETDREKYARLGFQYIVKTDKRHHDFYSLGSLSFSPFVHRDFEHLKWNMLGLLVVGSFLEQKKGRRYLFLSVFGGWIGWIVMGLLVTAMNHYTNSLIIDMPMHLSILLGHGFSSIVCHLVTLVLLQSSNSNLARLLAYHHMNEAMLVEGTSELHWGHILGMVTGLVQHLVLVLCKRQGGRPVAQQQCDHDE